MSADTERGKISRRNLLTGNLASSKERANPGVEENTGINNSDVTENFVQRVDRRRFLKMGGAAAAAGALPGIFMRKVTALGQDVEEENPNNKEKEEREINQTQILHETSLREKAEKEEAERKEKEKTLKKL